MVLRLPDSWSNWNLEMLVFEERGKPEYPEKNLSEQGREPTTNSTHIWRRRRDLNPGHIGGRRALSPLRHPCPQTNLFDLLNLVSSNIAKCLNSRMFYFANIKYVCNLASSLSIYRTRIPFELAFMYSFLGNGVMRSPKRWIIISLVFTPNY